MNDRLAGLLLFLPVPLVLALFVAQPLGSWPSLALGVLLMGTHRLYARPFALARAPRRCLWCGGPAGAGPQVEVEEPPGRTAWRACRSSHAEALSRTLGWASRHRLPLGAGILGTLAAFLVLSAAAALGRWPKVRSDDAVALFRLGIALTVLPFGWLGPTTGPQPRGRLPFPVHIQALLGTVWVIWLFRLVGLWWLAAGAVHVWHRLS